MMPVWNYLKLLGCFCVLSAAPAGALNRETPVSIEADYSASVLVFRVGRVSLSAELGREVYAANAHVEAAGLAALFTDFSIDSEVEGRFTAQGPAPVRYGHVEHTGDKTRIIDVAFDGGVARPTASPARARRGRSVPFVRWRTSATPVAWCRKPAAASPRRNSWHPILEVLKTMTNFASPRAGSPADPLPQNPRF